VEKDGKKALNILADEMTVDVELWYLPFGNKDTDPFLWNKETKTIKVSTTGK